MSQDCCSMTLLTFRPLSTSQLATLSMSTSTSQSVELVVDVNVAVSGASCRQRLSVSSVVTHRDAIFNDVSFRFTTSSKLTSHFNFHIEIVSHLDNPLSCTSMLYLWLCLSLSFCNTQKTLPQMHCSSSLITLALVSSFPYYLQPSDVSIWSIFSLSLSLMHKNTMAQVHSSSSFLFTLALVYSFTYYLHPYRCINYKYLSLSSFSLWVGDLLFPSCTF